MIHHRLPPQPPDPLIALLTGRLASGVWSISDADPDAVRVLAHGMGWTVATVEVAAGIDKAELLGRLARSVGFPTHYRANWDATADCLKDLPGPADARWLLLFDARAIRSVPPPVVTLVDVIDEAATFVEHHGGRLFALWIGPPLDVAPALSDL